MLSIYYVTGTAVLSRGLEQQQEPAHKEPQQVPPHAPSGAMDTDRSKAYWTRAGG